MVFLSLRRRERGKSSNKWHNLGNIIARLSLTSSLKLRVSLFVFTTTQLAEVGTLGVGR